MATDEIDVDDRKDGGQMAVILLGMAHRLVLLMAAVAVVGLTAMALALLVLREVA